jgi:sucrose-6F-phosphate phosphohydrolase
MEDESWRADEDHGRAPASDGESSGSKKVNIKKVPQAPAVRVYYSTGWEKAKLRTRWVGKRTGGADREEVKTAWKEVALHQTMARGLDGTPGRAASMEICVVDYIRTQRMIRLIRLCRSNWSFILSTQQARARTTQRPGATTAARFRVASNSSQESSVPFNQSILPPMMLVSDIDGTLVSHDDDETALTSTGRFARYWEDRAALTGSFLVFNTGRSFGQVMGLLEQMKGTLPVPDAIITAVGTKIFLLDREKGHRGTSSGLQWTEDVQWASSLDAGWDLEKVRRAASEVLVELSGDAISWLDDGSEHPHRIALSVHVNSVDLAMHLLREKMEAQGLNFKLIVSGTMEWRYLDCVSSNAGKHAALEHLRSMYGIAVDRCVAAGDSGNDILMLEGENPAIVVGNAQAALMEWAVRQPQDGRVVVADAAVADGVLEGLARLNLY